MTKLPPSLHRHQNISPLLVRFDEHGNGVTAFFNHARTQDGQLICGHAIQHDDALRALAEAIEKAERDRTLQIGGAEPETQQPT